MESFEFEGIHAGMGTVHETQGMPRLTNGEKVLQHIASHTRGYDNFRCAYTLTQDGIGQELGMTRAHASIELRKLMKHGLVDVKLAHVVRPDGTLGPIQRKVYVLVDPLSRATMRRLHAFAEFAYQALGPRECRELANLLAKVGTRGESTTEVRG